MQAEGKFREWWAWLSFPVLAVLVMIRLWADPAGRVLSHNDDDHGFFLFVMAHGERVLFHGENPFFTDRLNVPDGVNMMANTSILALSVPVAPVTHFLGAGVSLVLLLTLGLAGTAAAWYWVLRRLVTSPVAAWLGALWCGFCPAMVSHANGHINFVSQFVVPFIVWQVLRLREPGRVVRGGVLLGLLIVLQVFVNEEVLLFTALTLGVFVIAYALMAWPEAREVAGRVAAGIGVAAVTAGVLLIYPLWWQFSGPGHYEGQPFTPDEYVTDLLSLGAYARQSLAGNSYIAGVLSVSETEENTFFGLPLLVLLVIGVRMAWRRSVAARSVAIAALLMLLVSMGPHLRASGITTTVPLPFGLFSHLPVINLVSVTRFAMVTATLVGVLLALTVDRGVRLTGRARLWFLAGLVVALVPVLPKPLPTIPATPLPRFIAAEMWRPYVTGDRTVVPVPLPEVTTGREAMRWAALSNLEFRVPRGYFMGPRNAPSDLTGSWNAPHRPTSVLLWKVREYGQIPSVTPRERADAVADLTFWRAGVVVLVPGSRNVDALGVTLTQLLGRGPQQAGGVLLWDVRDLPVPPRG
ncbi:hypothetical protein [Actinoplanes sp. NPDC049265]|uniref:hypothetical protein n=1 Tax=Actinoplanes sp. NPDC049265 TaxID=3363902 RepID=UPI003723DFDB